MSYNSEYYLARATESAREASNTTLANVRVRHLQAEAAWRVMAERIAQREDIRSAAAAKKEASL